MSTQEITREASHDQGLQGCAFIALTFALPLAAQAEEIVVSNYGVTTNGMPYAVAMAKGFFKQQGADVTGILSSDGGGTTVRTMLGGNLAYGEINPTATVIAIQQGADLKIVSDNVQTVAEFIWAVKPDSPIKTAADLKGKKIGYTNPRSTSQALAILVLEKAGLKPDDAELVKTGGFGEGIVALDLGAVDITPIPEPLWSQHKANIAPWCRRATCCRRSTTSSASPPARPRKPRRLHPRRDPRAPPGGRLHVRQSGRVRRHHRQGLQSRARGRAQRGAQPAREPREVRRALLGRRRRSTSRP